MDRYIPEILMRDLAGHDRQPSAFLLYLYLWWRTSGQGEPDVALSLQDLVNGTGLAKRTLQSARTVLVRRKLVAIERTGVTDAPRYRVLSPWLRRK